MTLTLNPAIDESTSVAHVLSERKLRCGPPVYEPGGGGINVSRVLRRLGEDAPAIYPAGGPAGELLRQRLDAEGVTHWPVPIEGWTRENLNVMEEASGRQYRFCMPGPTLTEVDVERCLELVLQVRPTPAFVVSSGSLPSGVPAGFFARLARLVRASGARFVLDASGEPLRLALEEGVYLLKPSLREFQQLTGVGDVDDSRLLDLGRELVLRKACEILVLSLGSGGALWVTAGEAERVVAPAVSVTSSVGAGDSMVAGIVYSLARGQSVREAVRFGVAAASASVMRPGTSLCQRDDVERLAAAMQAVAI